MRVIAGTCKGHPLKAVKGMSTRPTTDKVKESIFNMVGPFFDGGIGLDLFAGSGGLGIEGLSRGLEKVIFVDKDPKAIATINENLNKCNFSSSSEVFRTDARRALKALLKRNITFSVVFLDPPYRMENIKELISIIEEGSFLDSNGFIVAEHDTKYQLPSEMNKMSKIRSESYGGTTVSIYKHH